MSCVHEYCGKENMLVFGLFRSTWGAKRVHQRIDKFLIRYTFNLRPGGGLAPPEELYSSTYCSREMFS